jgi:hypothetical protein
MPPQVWVGLGSLMVILLLAGWIATEQTRAPESVGEVEPVAATYVPPRGYLCYRARRSLQIDGRLTDPSWQAAPWTETFVDIEGDLRPSPRFRTRAKMLWDDEHFYVGAELEEPHVWATLTQHDAVIFHDNDFEVFIDPDGDSHEYYEFEINALNTGWDLLLPIPYKDGGCALHNWEIAGLKSAVFIDGTLNDPRDVDRGWSVEIAFPWKALRELARRPAPPRDGDQWRVNFSRVEWQTVVASGRYDKVPRTAEDNWVWSPQGVIDMHRLVQFSTAPPGAGVFLPDPSGPARAALHRVYYAQREFRRRHGRWAGTLAELGLPRLVDPSFVAGPRLSVTEELFEVTVVIQGRDRSRQRWHIRCDARVWVD